MIHADLFLPLPSTLDEIEQAANLADGADEPARSAYLDVLAHRVRATSWPGPYKMHASMLRKRLETMTDHAADLLEGIELLVAWGVFVAEEKSVP